MMAWARAGRLAAPRPPLLLLMVLVVITKSVLVVIPWVLTRVVYVSLAPKNTLSTVVDTKGSVMYTGELSVITCNQDIYHLSLTNITLSRCAGWSSIF